MRRLLDASRAVYWTLVLNRAESMLEKDRDADALRVYLRVAAAVPNLVRAHYACACLLAREERFAEAAEHAMRVCAQLPNEPNMCAILGHHAIREGDGERAFDHYTTAYLNGADDPSVAHSLITLLSMDGRTEEALIIAQRLIESGDLSALDRTVIATAYARDDQPETALRHLQAAMQDEDALPELREYITGAIETLVSRINAERSTLN
ncbi:MAG: hypothetical protein EA379_08135 [Phycisphaerales bacterium]|nr:MAG: hypothetical protein EA379_08135 [Phycisphaerales bacterium]